MRRFIVALGVALFVWGWGLTGFAEEQQQAFEQRNRAHPWGYPINTTSALVLVPSSYAYATGVGLMGLGAFCVAVSVRPIQWRKS